MMEKIHFKAGPIELEGLLQLNDSENGVVLAHPHPQYGGNMFDFVLESAENAFFKKGYATLKFNFRGVGKSQGRFDNGRGEQDDLLAAVSHLRDLGLKKIDLAGYSFGTWVISRINPGEHGVEDLFYISPPMGLMDFSGASAMKALTLVTTGSLDEYAPPATLRKVLEERGAKARLEVIEGADHFYGGYHYELEKIIHAHIGK
jgi:uncharacterized protein